ncbi:MAG: DsbA family protein [Planctomycetes bacterium]|nr:DsbA family protein [Planctomycetota bacterium]
MHPRACDTARAAEAAREQGKFWAFHDVLFKPRSKDKTTLKSMIEHLGLDFDEFETHRRSDAALARIEADIEQGVRLGVDGTPSVFINGRRVYDTRPQTLQFLIAHELEHAGYQAEPHSH